MISRLAVAALFSCLIINSLAFAQNQRPGLPANETPATNAGWPENYVLNLTGKDGETSIADITIMLAAPTFSVDAMSAEPKKEPTVTFAGFAVRDDNGGLTIQYTISMELASVASTQTSVDAKGIQTTNQNIQYKTATTRSTVRLNPGEAAEILRVGSRVWRLALDRVSATKE